MMRKYLSFRDLQGSVRHRVISVIHVHSSGSPRLSRTLSTGFSTAAFHVFRPLFHWFSASDAQHIHMFYRQIAEKFFHQLFRVFSEAVKQARPEKI
jgi:hypothetical protein